MIDKLRVEIENVADIFILEHRVKKFIKKNNIELPSLLLIAKELATNILKYGGQGYIEIKLTSKKIIVVVADDNGQKRENINELGISKGLGLGLKIIKNNSDEFKMKKNKIGGTTVTVILYLNQHSKKRFKLQIGIATKPHHLEEKSGDVCIFKAINERYLLVVADVLGHGVKANKVAELIKEYSLKYDNTSLYNFYTGLETILSGTRGCAVFAALISKYLIEYLNIGNIRTWIVSPKNTKKFLGTSGVVGRHPVKIKTFRENITLFNSTLIVCTDGITNRFTPKNDLTWIQHYEPQDIADRILDEFSIMEDDATAVVVRG